jgi:phytoene dehydrogenase-like protein
VGVPDRYDAVVVGAGPNGLVAANHLADAGWEVLVVEASDEPGGAVRTAALTAPGFRNDVFSAFYPLAVRSPALAGLELERYGLRWVQAPEVLAHPTPDGPTALLSRVPGRTAASLDRFAATGPAGPPGTAPPAADAGPADRRPGDGWLALFDEWQGHGRAFLDAMLSPVPPVRELARFAARLGPRRWLDFARFALVPVRRLAAERGLGPGGALMLAGNALHADLSPESTTSGLYGWLLASLGQDVGFPVPEGGAGRLAEALVARLEARGGRVATSCPVEEIVVERGRARGVVVRGGTFVAARQAVIAACHAEVVFRQLVGGDHLPGGFVERLGRLQRADATVKIDWALDGPIPWADPEVGTAGTVHLADSVDELTLTAAQLATGAVPARPFVLLGQMTTADPTRSPPGTESAWAYTHVPQRITGDAADAADGAAGGTAGGAGGRITGRWDAADRNAIVERIEDRIEAHAPGFRELVVGRNVMTPRALEEVDPSLVGGDISGGTQQLHQQLVFRPIPGLARPETPVAGLLLGSSSAHPGGGVHGACGANAARAALAHQRSGRRRLVAVGAALGAAGVAGARRVRGARGAAGVSRSGGAGGGSGRSARPGTR